jgi:formylmethanofuran dehydrogenase subunit C
MPLTLTLKVDTHVPVEVEGILPETLAGKTMSEIERLAIYHGNREEQLGQFFAVSGDAADETLIFAGDVPGVHWIGAKMTRGRIHIVGNAGRHLGSEMTGGEIVVDGNAGDWIGPEMRGGLIRVRGDAGHLVGAAYRGSPRGITGGTILVHGSAGNEVGLSMRRGLIAIGRSAGDLIGFNMLAGSIFVFGEAGIRPGAEMRRGTIALLGPNPPKLLPSFRRGPVFQPPMLRLMFRQLRALDFPIDAALDQRPFALHHGDLVSLGRGEILLPAA